MACVVFIIISIKMSYLEVINICLIAVASGLVGTFALMRRMILAADSVSHIALPGLGLALLFKINPLIGGAAALFLGALLIWFLENKTTLNTDVIIGVLFAASLAVGSLLTPGEELIEALFGQTQSVTGWELITGLVLALFIIIFIFFFKEKLTVNLVSAELAKVTGINTTRLNLYFILIFVLNIILGLKFLGVLLVGSLIIVPAAVGRNLGGSINSALLIAALAGALSVLVGYFIASAYSLSLGPIVISVATALFLLSLLKR